MQNNDQWKGGAASLFDRLVDGTDEDALGRKLGIHSIEDLKESVRREIERLFNTRTLQKLDSDEVKEMTVLDYGVPDYAAFYPPNQENQRRLKQQLATSLQTFEPRLRRVKVNVTKGGEYNLLTVTIDAQLVVDPIRENVSFPVVIKSHDTLVEVARGE